MRNNKMKYNKLYFKKYTKDDWYWTYLFCKQDVNDRLRVGPNGDIYRHPYSFRKKTYLEDEWVMPTYSLNQGGYKQFQWHNHTLQVHRVIAEAFCDKSGYDPNGTQWDEDVKLEVDHIDEDILNNSPTNLRWVSSDWNKRNILRREKEDNTEDETGFEEDIDSREKEYQYLMNLPVIPDEEYTEEDDGV